MSIDASTRAWTERANSTATRLLSGAGIAEVVAYRLAPQQPITALTHGLTADGQLAVVLPVGALDASVPVDVRLDVRKEAPELDARITASTVHLLGTLTWVPDHEVSLWHASGLLPHNIAAAADSPTFRLAVINTRRVVLHDAAGVTPIPFDDLAADLAAGGPAPFPLGTDEALAVELLHQHADVAALLDAVIAGQAHGTVLRQHPSFDVPEPAQDRTWLVDVDSTGVVLMRATAEETVTAFAAFAHPAHAPQDLFAAMGGLLDSARAA